MGLKPDGLVVIEDEEAAMKILDTVPLEEICGIGGRIKKRLNTCGIEKAILQVKDNKKRFYIQMMEWRFLRQPG